MPIFNFKDSEALGRVISADTKSVNVFVEDVERLKKLHVNQLTVLHSRKPGQYLIGVIVQIGQKICDGNILSTSEDLEVHKNKMNYANIKLIGTFYSRIEHDPDIFKKTLETVPDIGTYCFPLEGARLSDFMETVSMEEEDNERISIGRFTLYGSCLAYLNGNRFFQRHAMIVGSTGSGKSWTTAKLLEQMLNLPYPNAVLFDIHGEYSALMRKEIRKIKIAELSDTKTTRGIRSNVLYLPYWLLEYEDFISVLGFTSARAAPIQSVFIGDAVLDAKKKYVENEKQIPLPDKITVDSPIPFEISNVLEHLKTQAERYGEESAGGSGRVNKERILGIIERINSRIQDPRLAFMFGAPKKCHKLEWLEEMVSEMNSGVSSKASSKGGVKIIDFSKISSEFIPLVAGLIAHVIFSSRVWAEEKRQHPMAIICDEADRYMAPRMRRDAGIIGTGVVFDRIAKEGRKYGIGLVVICQRPAEINNAIVSQCNNIIVMRLPNIDDQRAVRGLLSDDFVHFDDLVPILGVGEALVIGDAVKLPAHLQIGKPESSMQPRSDTVDFWREWKNSETKMNSREAVRSWIWQGIPNHPDIDSTDTS